MEKKNKPAIRFKGFDEGWMHASLGSIVDLENGFAFKSKFFQAEESSHIVLTPGNVNLGGGFQFGKGHYYDTNGGFPDKFILNPNDIFLTMTDLTPTAQTLGLPALIPDDGKIYLHNQRLGKLVNIDAIKNFLFHLLCTPKFQKQIVLTSSGTTVKHTSPNKILTTKTNYPSDKTEQQKIGNFFENLDQLITQHQQKHSKLQALKKAMLGKMFPKQGQTVPEIRFRGFEGDWKETVISKLAEVTTGYPFDSKSFNQDGEYLVITNGNIQNEFAFVDTSNGNRIDVDSSLKQYVLDIEDILITMDGTVGRTAKVGKTKQVLAQRVGRLKAYSEPEFLYQLLNTGVFFQEMTLLSTGGTIKHISLSNISNYKVLTPSSEDEQKMIGNYFKNIDELINNHETKITKLQNIKKALLAKMFV